MNEDIITVNAVISACAKRLQWERALSLLDELQLNRLSPTVITYSASISACEKASQWQKVVSLFNIVSRIFVTDAGFSWSLLVGLFGIANRGFLTKN